MHMALGMPVLGDEGVKVGLGDPHGAAEVVRDQFLLLDPAANTAGRDAKGIGDLIDRVEFCSFHLLLHCIAKPTTAVRRLRLANGHSPFVAGFRAT